MHAATCTPTSKGIFCKKKKEFTEHANPEGNGPVHSKNRGRRGSTGPLEHCSQEGNSALQHSAVFLRGTCSGLSMCIVRKCVRVMGCLHVAETEELPLIILA